MASKIGSGLVLLSLLMALTLGVAFAAEKIASDNNITKNETENITKNVTINETENMTADTAENITTNATENITINATKE